MMQRAYFPTFLLCALALSGCVSREQADANLAKGCAAGVSALLPEGRTISEVKNTVVSASPEGPDYRRVTLETAEMDGWIEGGMNYECLFQESFGFLKTSHVATIEQVKFDGQVYGKNGSEISGSIEEFTRLTDAVRKAMYE